MTEVFDLNDNVIVAASELVSDTGDVIADVLTSEEWLDHLIEVAGFDVDIISDEGKKKFAVQVFNEYMSDERKYFEKQLEVMFG